MADHFQRGQRTRVKKGWKTNSRYLVKLTLIFVIVALPIFQNFSPHFFFLFRAKFYMLNDADKSSTCHPLVLPGRLYVICMSFARNTVKNHAADFQDVQQKNMFCRATVTFFCFRTKNTTVGFYIIY